jgi:hypothetical protein
VHTHLANTARNMYDTAAALLLAVEVYRATDEAAARELDRFLKQNGDPATERGQ